MTSPSDSNPSPESSKKNQFLFPRARYFGEFTPENLAFNANLQEFAQKVAYICAIETNGKMPPVDAYQEIKSLWQQLETSKTELLDRPKPPNSEAQE